MRLAQSHFNLLVAGDEEAWEGLSWSVDKDRLFEYTAAMVQERFQPLDGNAFAALQSLPTIFAYERACKKAAHLGRITAITHRNDGYGLAFELERTLPQITPEQLESLLETLDIERRFELNRTHWAVKNVDLAAVLRQAGLIPDAACLAGPPPPTALVSYSHDSTEHMTWVAGLALDLRRYGVEVLLDQWHVHAGHDLATFMRRGVGQCDFVIAIWTEKYVQKVLEGKGGAGFEHTLLSAELMRQVDTNKIIPVVRQTSSPRHVVPELASRRYIDLSDDVAYREGVESVARAVHKQQPALPPLGQPPLPLSPVR